MKSFLIGIGASVLLYSLIVFQISAFGDLYFLLWIYTLPPLLLFFLIADPLELVGAGVGILIFPRFFFPRTGLLIPLLLSLGWLFLKKRKDLPLSPKKAAGFFFLLAAVFLTFRGFFPFQNAERYKSSAQSHLIGEFSTPYHKALVFLTPSSDILPKKGASPDLEKLLATLGEGHEASWISVYANGINQTLAPWTGKTDFFYHAFVQPGLVLAEKRERILILGGKTDLAAKEALKWPEIKEVWNVDSDGAWRVKALEIPEMRLHLGALYEDLRLRPLIADPIFWISQQAEKFDAIFIEDPEPRRFPLARGFALNFFENLKKNLNSGGTVTISLGTFDEPDYWCVARTALAAGFTVLPHHSLDPNGFEGTLILSRGPVDLTGYEERLEATKWIQPELLLVGQALEYYRQPGVIESRTAPYAVHTLNRPACLPYLLSSN